MSGFDRLVTGETELEGYESLANSYRLRDSLSQALPVAQQDYESALSNQAYSVSSALKQAHPVLAQQYGSSLDMHAQGIMGALRQAQQALTGGVQMAGGALGQAGQAIGGALRAPMPSPDTGEQAPQYSPLAPAGSFEEEIARQQAYAAGLPQVQAVSTPEKTAQQLGSEALARIGEARDVAVAPWQAAEQQQMAQGAQTQTEFMQKLAPRSNLLPVTPEQYQREIQQSLGMMTGAPESIAGKLPQIAEAAAEAAPKLGGILQRVKGLIPGSEATRFPPLLETNYTRPLADFSPSMFRQASVAETNNLLGRFQNDIDKLFVSNTPDLALGQGENTGGLLLQFDAGTLKGQINRGKPMWQPLYEQGQAEFLVRHTDSLAMKDALQSITVPAELAGHPSDKEAFQRLANRLEQQGWEKLQEPDGATTFRRLPAAGESAVPPEEAIPPPEAPVPPGAIIPGGPKLPSQPPVPPAPPGEPPMLPPPEPPGGVAGIPPAHEPNPAALEKVYALLEEPKQALPSPREIGTRVQEQFFDQFTRLRGLPTGKAEAPAAAAVESGTALAVRAGPGEPEWTLRWPAIQSAVQPQLETTLEASRSAPLALRGQRGDLALVRPATDQVVDAIAKGEVPDAYNLALRFAGTQGESDIALVKELGPILQGARQEGNTLQDVSAMLIYRQVPELIENGFTAPGGLTLQDAQEAALAQQQRLGPEKFAKLQQAVDQIYSYIDKNLLSIEEGSFLSSEQVAKIRASNEHFFPHIVRDIGDRYFADLPSGVNLYENFSTRPDILEREGSLRPIKDPLSAIVTRTYTRLANVRKNEVSESIVDGLKQLYGDAIRIVPESYPTHSGEGTIGYFKDGVKFTYLVPEEFASAAKYLDRKQAGLITRIASEVNAVSRAGYTSLNPNFMLRNVVRDPLEAFYREGLAPFGYHHLKGLLSAMVHDVNWEEYLRSRAGISGLFEGGAGYETAERLAMSGKEHAWDTVKNPLELLRKANEIMEQGTRIGVFTQKAGLVKGPSLPGMLKGAIGGPEVSISEAALKSRRSTLDFGNGGALTRAINPYILFANANAQGLYMLREPLMERSAPEVARAVGRLAILGTAAATAWGYNKLWHFSDGREAYQDIPQYDRDNNITIIYGIEHDEKGREIPAYWRIPKPQVSKATWNLIEGGLEWAQGRSQRDAGQFIQDMAGWISPIPTTEGALPPALRVPLELRGNISYYQNRPIETPSEQLQPPEFVGRTGTTETGKRFSALFNRVGVSASPVQTEYAIRGILGGGGMAALQGADVLGRAAGAYPQAPATKETPGVGLTRQPVISGLVAARGGQYREQAMQALTKEQQQIAREELQKLTSSAAYQRAEPTMQRQLRAAMATRIDDRFARRRAALSAR